MSFTGWSGCLSQRCPGLIRSAVLITWSLIASACVAPAENKPGENLRTVAEREALLAELTQFQFSGGLGIWTEHESISARIKWQQSADALSVNLSGPLGFGEMQLSDGEGIANLQRGDVQLASGSSVDQVLQRGLGLAAPVPVEQLQQWVRGLPGDALSILRDAQGQLSSLRYKDATGTAWMARFRRYARLDDNDMTAITLPSLITASGGPYSVRLVLKNWQVTAESAVPESHESNKRLAIPGR